MENINEYMKKEKEINLKWLEYMNKQEISKIIHCPNVHSLVAYLAVNSDGIPTGDWIITCPLEICDYYDFNTFKVPNGTIISKKIRRLSYNGK